MLLVRKIQPSDLALVADHVVDALDLRQVLLLQALRLGRGLGRVRELRDLLRGPVARCSGMPRRVRVPRVVVGQTLQVHSRANFVRLVLGRAQTGLIFKS